jgi:hypothetical protein
MGRTMMLHYTDEAGHKAISSQVDWTFKAAQPPGDRPFGAYFTTLRPDAHRFSARTRIPKVKQIFAFGFDGDHALEPVAGGKGAYIFFSAVDYTVAQPRQRYHGPTEQLP